MKSNLKNILGTHAYWVVNKQLANTIGLDATILLQHLIDLQDGFFNKTNKPFFQQQERLLEQTPLKLKALKNARKVLLDKNLITYKRGYKALYYYDILTDNILSLLNTQSSNVDSSTSSKVYSGTSSNSDSSTSSNSDSSIPHTIRINNNKNKDNKNKNNNVDKRILDTLIKVYPKNRVNSHAPILKYLSKCTDEQKKLIVANVKRYLKAAGDYTRNLRNYLEHECYTEEWLKAEETKFNKADITTKSLTSHNFSNSDWDELN